MKRTLALLAVVVGGAAWFVFGVVATLSFIGWVVVR